MTLPCLCKVDCGTTANNKDNPLLWLFGVATLLLLATAAFLLRSSRPAGRLLQLLNNNNTEEEEAEEEDDDASASEEEVQEVEDPESDPAQALRQELQHEFETRFRDQEERILTATENLYQEYNFNNDHRQHQLSERVERDTTRLHGVTDGLKRRIADQQSALRSQHTRRSRTSETARTEQRSLLVLPNPDPRVRPTKPRGTAAIQLRPLPHRETAPEAYT